MNGLKNVSVRRIVGASMMAAIVCVATLIHVPLPLVGYIHVGDAFVLVSGFLFGFAFGFGAAATGSLLADLLLGYASYAPATFVIKALMDYVRRHSFSAFGIYRIVLGVLVLAYFLIF